MKAPSMSPPAHQRGVALITALLVVALATIAAVALASQVQLHIRRTSNLLDVDQAWEYIKGAEAWGMLILMRDLNKSKTDNLQEVWAQTLPPVDLPGGYMVGRIEDLQGRFNINSLVVNGVPNAAARERFERLLIRLGIEPELTQAVIDWIDADVEATPPNGAEDDYYAGLDPPYRTANQPFVHSSELRLIKGFDQARFTRLAPFVAALPARVGLNVNTAPPEVLASLSPNLTVPLAIELAKLRVETPFQQVTELSAHPLLNGMNIDAKGLGVTSEYFLLHIETHIGQGHAQVQSLVERKNQTRVLQRAQEPYGDFTTTPQTPNTRS